MLLIGDAAGWVSPLTGGGIHRALEAGRIAGRALARHLREGGPAPATVLAAAAPRYRVKRLLRAAMALPPPDWSFELLVRAAPLARVAARIFFHRAATQNRAVGAARPDRG